MASLKLIVVVALLAFFYGCSFNPTRSEWFEELGRFEFREAAAGLEGVVIGSPHGSYDEFTAEMVRRLSYRTGFAAVN